MRSNWYVVHKERFWEGSQSLIEVAWIWSCQSSLARFMSGKNEDMNFVGIKYRNSVHNIAIFCYFITFMLFLSCHISGYTTEQFVILGREEQHIGELDAAVPSSSAERSLSRHQPLPEEDA